MNEWSRRFEPELRIEAEDLTTNLKQPVSNTSADLNISDNDYAQRKYSLILGGKSHMAALPADISHPKILHLGCGNGAWVRDMGREYPYGEVLGVDQTAIDSLVRSPDNCRFEIEDLETKGAWDINTFHLIYSRDVYSKVKDWDTYIDNIYAYLAPGGSVELTEWDIAVHCDDGTFFEATNCHRFYQTLLANLKKSGRDLSIPGKLKTKLEGRGFENVSEMVMKVPMSGWPKDPKMKELGTTVLGSSSGLYQYAEAMLGFSKEEAGSMVAGVLEELRSHSVHLYSQVRIIIAEKPHALGG